MTLRMYLALMITATLAAWLAFGIVLLSVNPEATNWLGIALFYVTALIALTGTGACLGFVVRFLFLKRELIVRSVLVAFRQGFLMALFVTIILFLSSHDLLNVLNVVLLILGLSALEFLLLSFESDHSDEM